MDKQRYTTRDTIRLTLKKENKDFLETHIKTTGFPISRFIDMLIEQYRAGNITFPHTTPAPFSAHNPELDPTPLLYASEAMLGTSETIPADIPMEDEPKDDESAVSLPSAEKSLIFHFPRHGKIDVRKLTTDDIPYELVDIAVPTDFGFSSFKEKQELALRVYHTAKAGELLYMWYTPGGYKVDELEELNPGIELIVFDSRTFLGANTTPMPRIQKVNKSLVMHYPDFDPIDVRKLTKDNMPQEGAADPWGLVNIVASPYASELMHLNFIGKMEKALQIYHKASRDEILQLWLRYGNYRAKELLELNPGSKYLETEIECSKLRAEAINAEVERRKNESRSLHPTS